MQFSQLSSEEPSVYIHYVWGRPPWEKDNGNTDMKWETSEISRTENEKGTWKCLALFVFGKYFLSLRYWCRKDVGHTSPLYVVARRRDIFFKASDDNAMLPINIKDARLLNISSRSCHCVDLVIREVDSAENMLSISISSVFWWSNTWYSPQIW